MSIVIPFMGSSQIVVTNNLNPTQLVQNVLLGTGVTATNIKFNGVALTTPSVQTGSFTSGNSTFPFSNGIVLSSGNVPTLAGNASSFFSTNPPGNYSDVDLNAIATATIYDAAVLEFDFIATSDSVSFKYVFGSEEYPEFVGSAYNDAFGFFISGPGIMGPYSFNGQNIALLPGTATSVSINNVNNGTANNGPCSNCSYYINNSSNYYGMSSKFDGLTTQLTAKTPLQCGSTYHIKMAIGDAGDNDFDSGVFLEGNSFTSGLIDVQSSNQIFGNAFADSILVEDCSFTTMTFIRPQASDTAQYVYHLTTTGTIDTSTDLVGFSDSVVFDIGVDTVVVQLTPFYDGITEPLESILIKGFVLNSCGDTLFMDSMTLYIMDKYQMTHTLIDTMILDCPSDNPTVAVTNIANSIPNYSYSWSNGSGISSTTFTNTSINHDSTYLFVTITDGCGTDYLDSVLFINQFIAPTATLLPNDTIYTHCVSDSALVVVQGSGTASPYTYIWSSGSTNDSTYFVDILGQNGHEYPFSITLTDACEQDTTINGVFIVNQTLQETLTSTPTSPCFTDGNANSTTTGSSGTVNYMWVGPSPSFADTAYTQNFPNVPSGWWTLTTTDAVCSVTDSVQVNLNSTPVPNALINANTLTGDAPATFVFSNESQNATNYEWDFGNGTNATTTDLTSQSITYTTSGTYLITLTASLGDWCTSPYTIEITVFDKPTIYVPNVFTPNGDGNNDDYFIDAKHIQEIHLSIMNRWGNTLFDQTNVNPVWDGFVDGKLADDGTYYYKYTAKGVNGDVINGSGFLQLISDK